MAFSTETFTLLQELRHSIARKEALRFYRIHRDALRMHIREPFQELFTEVAGHLPPEIHKQMVTTENSIFGQIWLGGGAVPFFWGAFYPKRSTRKQLDIQLLAFLAPTYLEFGTFFGWECRQEYLTHFKQNYRQVQRNREHHSQLLGFLKEKLPESSMVHRASDYTFGTDGSLEHTGAAFTWGDLLSMRLPLGRQDPSPMVVLSQQHVLDLSTKELTEQIARTFTCLFPLVLLTTSQQPLPQIEAYIAAHQSV